VVVACHSPHDRIVAPILVLVGLTVALAAALVLLWATATNIDHLLAPANGWSPTDFNNQPPTTDIPPVYRNVSDTRLWRNWPSPERSHLQGEVWSAPFMPPSIMGVPVGGSTRPDYGNQLVIECAAERRQRPLARLDVYNRLSFALIDTRDFCTGEIRIGALSQGRALLMLGTPAAVPAEAAFAIRYLVPLLGAALSAFLIGLIWTGAGLAAASAAPQHAATFGLLTTGIAAMAMFWAFSISAAVGIGALSAVAVASILFLSARWHSRDVAGAARSLAAPFAAWLIFSLLIISLGAAIDNGSGYAAANTAFFPAAWFTDNLVPATIARALAMGVPLDKIDLGPWHAPLISDRTPLAYGYLLLIENLLIYLIPEGLRFSAPIAEQAAGVVVIALWVPAAWLGLRLAGLRDSAILKVLCLTAFTGFAIFHTFYIWPKLLAGGFGLLMILSLAALRDQSQPPTAVLSIAAVSAALAFLSHPAAILGVVGALIVFAPAILRQGPRPVLISGAIGAALLASWFIWQSVFQPGSNALARFALTGAFGYERRDVSVLTDLIAAYSDLTPLRLLQMKINAVLTQFGAFDNAGCTFGPHMSIFDSGIRALRFNEFYFLFYVAGLPVCAAVCCKLFPNDHAERAGPWTLLLSVGVVTLILWLAVMWWCQILITSAYQAVLAVLIGCWGLAFAANRKLAALFAILSIAIACAAWVVDPLYQALAVRWLWLALFGALLGGVVGYTSLTVYARYCRSEPVLL
jgi:hypothetical protein